MLEGAMWSLMKLSKNVVGLLVVPVHQHQSRLLLARQLGQRAPMTAIVQGLRVVQPAMEVQVVFDQDPQESAHESDNLEHDVQLAHANSMCQ